jgi:hypothetical protein
MHPFGPKQGPHDGESGPGCSVRSTAVLQAHAKTRARPVLAFSGIEASSSWVRIWNERANSRRAMATVAMFLPRRRASWA